jgi:hypothetical protein
MNWTFAIWLLLFLTACEQGGHDTNSQGLDAYADARWYAAPRDVPAFDFHYQRALRNLPTGEAMRERLCFGLSPADLGKMDPLRRAFCQENPPQVTSLQDLQKALGLAIPEDMEPGKANNGVFGATPGFVLTGHSTSLVSRYVSPINPRVILFSAPKDDKAPDDDFIVMGFVRGDQFVEVATREPRSGNLNFYLIKFEQVCNETDSCTIGHLQTEAIEKNWTSITIYQDRFLTNTVFDCTHCHQPEGPLSDKILRMQEIERPWTHFFRDDTSGSTLIQAFQNFHGDQEGVGGIPAKLISSSDPEKLSWLLKANGFGEQPNVFQSQQIQNERAALNGPGEVWLETWEQYLSGDFIPSPSWRLNILDAEKVAKLKGEWLLWRQGEKPLASLPDLRKATDDRLGPSMGTRAPNDISGRELLDAACKRCHNEKLDQTLGKSRFTTNLEKMPVDEIQLAIDRLELLKTKPNSPIAMPPRMFMDLTEAEIDLLMTELKSHLNE